jgi:hypothetical protein
MRLLEAAGYAVTRAAASLGAWDLVAIGSTDVALVQVKTRDWPGLVEMETLRLFPAPSNARKLVHRWRDRQLLDEIEEEHDHDEQRYAAVKHDLIAKGPSRVVRCENPVNNDSCNSLKAEQRSYDQQAVSKDPHVVRVEVVHSPSLWPVRGGSTRR